MEQVMKSTEPELPAFYRGRSIFVTGATGFVGKVLLERLLSTCPQVDTVYILMRAKKGASPQIRLQQLIDCPVFDQLRKKNRSLLDKIEMVAGDVTMHGLGMTSDAYLRLRDVSLVFHVAATVKMEGRLRQAVKDNLIAVIRLLDFCDTLPKLEAFMHVSTTYSNTDVPVVEERVYPPPMELPALLKLVEDHDFDEETTKKYIGSKPNSYTFTKAMAETVVQRHGCKNYSTAIFRPSIVISCLQHPFPGWIENLNGPSGVIAGVGSGLLRVFNGSRTAAAALIPADIVVDTLLAAAWETAIDKLDEVRVYNCANTGNPITWGEFQEVVNKVIVEYPANDVMMYPRLLFVQNRFLYKLLEMSVQTIPAHIMDYAQWLFGRQSKKNFAKINSRLCDMCEVLRYFTLRQWEFQNENVCKLRNRLTSQDRALYNLDPETIDWNEAISSFVKGTRKYVRRESDLGFSQARARVKRFGYILTTVAVILGLLMLRFVGDFVIGIFY